MADRGGVCADSYQKKAFETVRRVQDIVRALLVATDTVH